MVQHIRDFMTALSLDIFLLRCKIGFAISRFSGRGMGREFKFPDRVCREIGKYLWTSLEIWFLSTPGEDKVELNYLKVNFDSKSVQSKGSVPIKVIWPKCCLCRSRRSRMKNPVSQGCFRRGRFGQLVWPIKNRLRCIALCSVVLYFFAQHFFPPR